jgi:hypothetical protein
MVSMEGHAEHVSSQSRSNLPGHVFAPERFASSRTHFKQEIDARLRSYRMVYRLL